MNVNYRWKKHYKTAKYPIRQPLIIVWLIWLLSKIMLIGNVVEMSFTKGQYFQGSGLALILMLFVVASSLIPGDDEAEASVEGGVVLP